MTPLRPVWTTLETDRDGRPRVQCWVLPRLRWPGLAVWRERGRYSVCAEVSRRSGTYGTPMAEFRRLRDLAAYLESLPAPAPLRPESEPRSDPWDRLAELKQRMLDDRWADYQAREAAGGTARLAPGTYDIAYFAVLELRQGTVLHCAGLTVGRGQLVDWRTVKSGEVVCEGPDCLLAVETIRRVGLEPLAAALVVQ